MVKSSGWPHQNESIFFLIQSNARRGTSKMQTLWISKDPCITEEKGKLIKCEGGGVGVCALGFWRFEDFKCWERWRPGDGEWSGPAFFQFNRERVLGIGKRRATRKHAFGKITDFNSSTVRFLSILP